MTRSHVVHSPCPLACCFCCLGSVVGHQGIIYRQRVARERWRRRHLPPYAPFPRDGWRNGGTYAPRARSALARRSPILAWTRRTIRCDTALGRSSSDMPTSSSASAATSPSGLETQSHMRQQHEHMGRTASVDAVRRCGNAAARRRGGAARRRRGGAHPARSRKASLSCAESSPPPSEARRSWPKLLGV